MKKNFKRIAVLNITSRCNLRCKFCFGPENTRSDEMSATNFVPIDRDKFRPDKIRTQFVTPELTTSRAKSLILKLKKSGAKILIFSGGEPLLRRDIFELICFAKKQGFYTVLHTNGMLINKLKAQSLKFKTSAQNSKLNSLSAVTPKRIGVTRKSALLCLDQINLPLDGNNAKINDAMRCRGHFKKIMEALKLLRNNKIRVIISTVATAKNKNAVVKIGKILPSWIYKWRIFQFNPQGKAAQGKKEFAISNREFKEISRQARNLTKKSRFKVQCVGVKDKEFWKGYNIIN